LVANKSNHLLTDANQFGHPLLDANKSGKLI